MSVVYASKVPVGAHNAAGTAALVEPSTGPQRWTGRSRGGRFGHWFFITLVRIFGVRAAYVALVPVAFYFVLCAPTARRAAMKYHARLHLPGGRLRRGARVYWHFLTFGQILLDRAAAYSGQVAQYKIEINGQDDIAVALAQGRGVVILSGHCGNWELAARKLAVFGRRVNVVAYRGEAEAVLQMLEQLTVEGKPALIEADGSIAASLAIVGALARGEVVAMHGDRALGGMETAEVEFLGALARFPTGPHLVAAAARAPVIHAFATRQGTYRYQLVARLAPQRGERSTREQVTASLRCYVAALEAQVRAAPLHWQNFYDFWEAEAPGAST